MADIFQLFNLPESEMIFVRKIYSKMAKAFGFQNHRFVWVYKFDYP